MPRLATSAKPERTAGRVRLPHDVERDPNLLLRAVDAVYGEGPVGGGAWFLVAMHRPAPGLRDAAEGVPDARGEVGRRRVRRSQSFFASCRCGMAPAAL